MENILKKLNRDDVMTTDCYKCKYFHDFHCCYWEYVISGTINSQLRNCGYYEPNLERQGNQKIDDVVIIVTIIGSTKFRKEIYQKAWEFTKNGFLVMYAPFAKEEISELEEYREILEKIHYEKIRLSDIVFVFNRNKYIGKSTQEELDFAKKLGKQIRYLEE